MSDRSTLGPSRSIDGLLRIMSALRDPEHGCPWDVRQDFRTIAPYTIEEAYEVADAIEREDFGDLADELGDLLLQVVFHARMAEEVGRFDFGDVVEAITRKLVRRHPHVFGEADRLSADAVARSWAAIKAQEKRDREGAGNKADGTEPGLLDAVPTALPALTRAVKLQSRASTVGFDWKDARLVIAKIREELDETEVELDRGADDAIRAEIGDLLFAVANLARHAGVDAEGALRHANRKFERRFRYIEAALACRGKLPQDSSLAEMDSLWNAAKDDEAK